MLFKIGGIFGRKMPLLIFLIFLFYQHRRSCLGPLAAAFKCQTKLLNSSDSLQNNFFRVLGGRREAKGETTHTTCCTDFFDLKTLLHAAICTKNRSVTHIFQSYTYYFPILFFLNFKVRENEKGFDWSETSNIMSRGV